MQASEPLEHEWRRPLWNVADFEDKQQRVVLSVFYLGLSTLAWLIDKWQDY
jgi:hypothetical protein